MVAKLYCTRRLQFRDGWALVTRLKFALAALIAIGVPGAAAAASHTIALFPSASSPHWTGFARVINHSEGSGTVRITGIDDAGREHGPVELELEDRAAAHFNSRDLEEGNAGKGLSDGLGDGEGDWRLRLESELAVEVLSYVRTGDGFVTAMHEGVPARGRRRHVRFFNPGSNTSQVSRLRLVNPTGNEVEVTIEGRDDAGEPAPGGEVRLRLGAGEARDVGAQALESGGDGLDGSLGDGSGKWQLFVSSDAAIEVMSLLESPTGHLSNLSGPGLRDLSGGKRELELPLFMSASDDVRQGFARLLNHSDESGTVRIYGIDDEGRWSGPVVLALAPGAAAHFNSGDLERGSTAKGLEGALGSGSGSWRLRLYTELDVEAFAYVRTGDGFVTTVHERVRESAMRYHVAFFNPGSNASQVSSLRLVNPAEDEVEVRIAGRDDEGEPAPGGEVRLTLAAGEARTLTAQALESGGDGLVGSLGDGSGKWQLFVSADGAVEVVNLLRSPTGHLANLSVAGVAGVVSEAGIDRPVGLNIVVAVPNDVMSVRASDLETTVLGSDGDGAPPGGAPSLLVASDADGAVMYALVNEDGGLLGEAPGTVRVSVASTAVVLVALAAGYRIPSVTPEAVSATLSHSEFGALTRALTRLMGADKSYLARLSDYPDVVAMIQRMAESLTGATAAALVRSGFTVAEAALLARAKRSAADTGAVLPGGIVKEDFYCTPLTRWPCSPWDAHEPWRWFGNARGAEAYYPDGTSWTDFFLAVAPGGVFAESYADFLEEAAQPPFLARSEAEGARAVHAAANPSFVRYAMELHEGSQFRRWYYVPGNATTLDKLRNSGAAYREVLAGEGRLFGPHIDRIRFERYRLTGRAVGRAALPDHAAVVSFLNTFGLVSSIANVVTDAGAVEAWLDNLAQDPRLYLEVASCASGFAEHSLEADDPNRPVFERMVTFFEDVAPGLFGMVLTDDACRALVVRAGGEGLERVLREFVAQASLDAIVSALTGVKPFFDAANDVVPSAVSYFAPGAARSEYYIEWDETPAGQAYIARVSQRPLPVAAFTYAQQRGFRVELDASQSKGEGLRYEWQAAGRRIGTGRVLTHDFRAADTFDVTLTVRDRSGVTAVERGAVSVTAGRVPEVRGLTCTPTGEGTAFAMQAELSDADNDIDSVQWFSNISNPSPDRVTGGDGTSVTLSAPVDALHTRAKVRVVDARGNEAERNCLVEFDSAPSVPRISDVSAEEGEALEFTVTLDRAPADALTYYYATYRADARDDDYDGHFATALDFAPGERTETITVHTTEDEQVERNETFYVYITESTSDHPFQGLPVRYLARAAGTILDDDETEEAAPVPRIADAGAEEGEAIEFTVTLDRTTADAVTFHYATYRGTAGSDDYDGHYATTLRFGPGERSKTIAVQTTEDTQAEDDETLYVYVTDSGDDLTPSRPTRYLARATGTIRDDDPDATTACTGPTVHIPDAALRRVVEQALGTRRGAAITPEDMMRLDLLLAEEAGIESLTGLQCATELTGLSLHDNNISDVSLLAGLTNLTRLSLNENRISDLSPLAGLTDLTVLVFWDNQVSDLSPMTDLTNLTRLQAFENRISDLSPLAGLTNLTELWLEGNRISDLSPLAGLTELWELNLAENRISDLSPLSGLTNLTRLDLWDNRISDLSPLAGLTAFEWLFFGNNRISDLSPLAGLTDVGWLVLCKNRISEIGPLVAIGGLGQGDSVELQSNPLSDESRNVHIPALMARGVNVHFERSGLTSCF